VQKESSLASTVQCSNSVLNSSYETTIYTFVSDCQSDVEFIGCDVELRNVSTIAIRH